jgi:hypothetical protein
MIPFEITGKLLMSGAMETREWVKILPDAPPVGFARESDVLEALGLDIKPGVEMPLIRNGSRVVGSGYAYACGFSYKDKQGMTRTGSTFRFVLDKLASA